MFQAGRGKTVRHREWWQVEFEVGSPKCLARDRSSKTFKLHSVPLLVFQVWASGVCEFLEVVYNILCLSASEKFSGERILEFHYFPKELHGLRKVKNHSWQIFCHWKWVRWGAEDRQWFEDKLSPAAADRGAPGHSQGSHSPARAAEGLVTVGTSGNGSTHTFLAPFSQQARSAFCLLHLSHYSVLSLIVKATLQGRKHYGVERLGREWKHHMFYSKNKVRRWACEGNKKANAVTKAIQWQWC